jgi:hypothetical protein
MWSLVRSPKIIRVAVLATSFAIAYAGVEQTAWSQTPDTEAWDGAAVDESSDMDPAALSQFQQPLAPYGTWVDDPTYGTVWVPSPSAVGSDFTPYVTAGHWALSTDNQWTWVSDYSWGSGPFHYGRWVMAQGRWAWIPGREYAPAWVVWRTGTADEPYVGWSPMPPTYGFRGGVAVRLPVAPRPRYVYVPSRYAFNPGLRTYVAPPARVAMIAPRTRPYVEMRAGVRYQPRTIARGPTIVDARIPARTVPAHRVGAPANPFPARGRVGVPTAPPVHGGGPNGHDDRGRDGSYRR